MSRNRPTRMAAFALWVDHKLVRFADPPCGFNYRQLAYIAVSSRPRNSSIRDVNPPRRAIQLRIGAG